MSPPGRSPPGFLSRVHPAAGPPAATACGSRLTARACPRVRPREGRAVSSAGAPASAVLPPPLPDS
eukprot:2478238-Pleurochrysis_carterae.AAC.1